MQRNDAFTESHPHSPFQMPVPALLVPEIGRQSAIKYGGAAYTEKFKGRCSCCQNGTRWQELEPANTHRFRVHCAKCDSYAKWGNKAEYQSRFAAGEPVTFVPYGAWSLDGSPHTTHSLEELFS